MKSQITTPHTVLPNQNIVWYSDCENNIRNPKHSFVITPLLLYTIIHDVDTFSLGNWKNLWPGFVKHGRLPHYRCQREREWVATFVTTLWGYNITGRRSWQLKMLYILLFYSSFILLHCFVLIVHSVSLQQVCDTGRCALIQINLVEILHNNQVETLSYSFLNM